MKRKMKEKKRSRKTSNMKQNLFALKLKKRMQNKDQILMAGKYYIRKNLVIQLIADKYICIDLFF